MYKICIFLAIVSVASAATFMGRLPAKPKELAHKEGCYISEINDVVPFRTEVKPIGNCMRISCGQRYIHYATCGTVGTTDQQCYVTEGDLTRTYPDCCPGIECESDNFV